MHKPVLLFLEDELKAAGRQLIATAKGLGYDVLHAETVDEAIRLSTTVPQVTVALVDLRIGDEDDEFGGGWRFIDRAQLPATTQVIIFSGHPRPESIATERPAGDKPGYYFLRKNRDEHRVVDILTDQMQRWRSQQSKGIINESAQDQRRQADLPMIAASGLPVLITGATGVGKENVAEQIARLSLPAEQWRRIRVVNCAALTEEFAIAWLFGYMKGAYTGAAKDTPGVLENISGKSFTKGRGPKPAAADQLPGILILDELAELPPFVQAQMLRMMQGQPINRLGDTGDGYTPVIRFIACTNDELKLSRDETFRKDLLGRLDGWHITVGPPHERPETFIRAARTEAVGFSMPLEFGKAPIKITDVAEDALDEIRGKLVPDGLRFGFRELKGWVGRACAIALYREKNDTQLTAADLRNAWEKRMRLVDRAVISPEMQPPPPVAPPAEKVAALRDRFEEIFKRAGAAPSHASWDETDLKAIADKLAASNRPAYLELVNLKKKFTTSSARQQVLYQAINAMAASDTDLKRFRDRLRQHLRDSPKH